jgi:D-serine deaminase-like pyridoxal phosphate-dependent protein
MSNWYEINNIDQVDSPALVIYADRVKENIKMLIGNIDNTDRLRPHIKTHKSLEVSRMMLDAGVKKFKCATIAEAEMLAVAGATDVLLAYQPVGPKAERLAALKKKFPNVLWSCLIDNFDSAKAIAGIFSTQGLRINVFIDLNVGMNRTGIVPERAHDLFTECQSLKGIDIVGLHAYDGHLRDTDLSLRTKKCDEGFARVVDLEKKIASKFGKQLIIVAGGTPTFSIHSKRKEIECSPGTFIYWDKGYEQILQEQHYVHAALVISRVISIPAEDIICTDLGHKAIASENPLQNRVSFLNAPELEPIGHSEEHMVFKNPGTKKYSVGDVLYGVPYHVCPTIALYENASIVENGLVKNQWLTDARKRKITI